jgi:hypothetical protein
VQKFATGAKIRQLWRKRKSERFFSYSSAATSRRSEKTPLNYSQNLFGSTASRAQSGARDGFWLVISNALAVKSRAVLS